MDEHEISLLPLQLNWKSHDIYIDSAATFYGIRENKDVWGRGDAPSVALSYWLSSIGDM